MPDDLQRHPLAGRDYSRRVRELVRSEVRRAARPVRGVLASMAGLGAQLMARAGEVLTEVEVAQQWGFASVVPPLAEVVAVPIGGSSGHLVVVGTIDRISRPDDLLPGEAVIYSIAGAQVKTTATGLVQLNGGGAGVARVGDAVQVTIDATAVASLAAQMVAAGLVTAGAGSGATPAGVVVSGTVTSGSATVSSG